MKKQVLNSEELRERTLTAVDTLANAVKTTLGPRGRNAVLPRPDHMPFITNDGVTIAKMTYTDDPAEYMGIKLLREVSARTNNTAGDGTTTATVLAQHIIHEGYTNITAGANQVGLKNGILSAAKVAFHELGKIATPVSTREDIEKIATISSDDEEIGKMIGEVMERNGLDGSINIKESHSLETTLEIIEGMQFGKGFVSENLLQTKTQAVVEYDNPLVLVTDEKISYAQQILPLLEKVLPLQRPLLIIAEALEGEALGFLAVNIQKGILKCIAVNPPGFGDNRLLMMEDIATVTGAEFISAKKGMELHNAEVEMLGSADTVKVNRERTIILGGKGDPEKIKARVAGVRTQIKEDSLSIDNERIKERLASLCSGVSMIHVGAATEVEAKEKMLRIEDAVQAARAAMADGIVPGGGTAFMLVRPAVEKYIETLSGDMKTGAEIILSALTVPMRQIAINAGMNGDAIVERFYEQPTGYGYDAAALEWKNMMEAGIIDPARVSRQALVTAASLAATLLTSDAGVAITAIDEVDTY